MRLSTWRFIIPPAQTLSLNDYQIRDITSETATDWKIPEGTSVEAGKTLILWIGNGESQNLETEDFCAHYGLDQNEVQIVKTEDVMAGLDGRTPGRCRSQTKRGRNFRPRLFITTGKKRPGQIGASASCLRRAWSERRCCLMRKSRLRENWEKNRKTPCRLRGRCPDRRRIRARRCRCKERPGSRRYYRNAECADCGSESRGSAGCGRISETGYAGEYHDHAADHQ